MRLISIIKFSGKSFFYRFRYRSPVVMNRHETIEYIIQNKSSIARYGDGELSLMEGRSIGFQSYNPELARRLKEVHTTDTCLVCIPNVFRGSLNKKEIVDDSYKFWKRSNFVFGGIWNKYFSHMDKLGDAFLSRFYIRYRDKSMVGEYVEKLKRIWNQKDIVFVEGENSKLGIGNDLFDNAKSIKRIICPSTNAFDKYNQIFEHVKELCKDDDIIIIALGPTATVLAYDLSNCGFWALDMGHIDIEYEWYKMGVENKVPIKSKHVNECGSMGDNALNNDVEYNSQIIYRI